MKILGGLFICLVLVGVGYCACHFGWLDGVFSLFAK